MNILGITPNTHSANAASKPVSLQAALASPLKPQSPVADVMIKTAQYSLGTGLTLTKRLYNGVADVVKMFLPPQLGKTIKHTIMGTAGMSAFSFILTGPFHLPALPAFAVASLGFDMAYTFVNGIFRSPNPPQAIQKAYPPQNAQNAFAAK